MTFPDPVIEVAIEPKTKGDQEKLGTAIQRLAEEDPTFRSHRRGDRPDDHRRYGRAAPRVLVDRMRREFRVEANVGKPQVAYRETIRKKVENHSYTHKKQTGGSGQFAKVIIGSSLADPETEAGRGLRVRQQRHRWPHPAEYIPSVDAGAQDAMEFGVLAGYPMVDIKVTLDRRRVPRRRLLGAGVQDRRQPWPSRRPHARPIPSCSSRCSPSRSPPPRTYMGDVIGDLNSRRGQSAVHGGAHGRPRRRRSCRCRRCSGTLAISGRRPRVRRRTRWSSTPTPRFQERRRRDHQEGPRRVVIVQGTALRNRAPE
jgi:elongation factor G